MQTCCAPGYQFLQGKSFPMVSLSINKTFYMVRVSYSSGYHGKWLKGDIHCLQRAYSLQKTRDKQGGAVCNMHIDLGRWIRNQAK